MPTICRAFLINDGGTTEFIVNFTNLAIFVQEHINVSNIVVIGSFDNYFVLSVKKGKIENCSDSAVKKVIVTELSAVNYINRPILHSYKGFAQCQSVRTVNIASTSLMRAKEDFEKWTNAPLRNLIKIA
ncbi:hypothetical protein FAY30_26250 (plasmid) [Bacillus sp. S3]|uniref:hypothetical protein n=1 Tax=Bacillus sp. S3 TaxID=486398 RepID=UPI00118A2391|nr:hypothetical protein [Bacillus sp. S3]QCJ45449.1 hypothetical protein FAY30_26250 [Bacillus sp. S3]